MNKPEKFYHKPLPVEAIQYLPHQNCEAVGKFTGCPIDELSCDNEREGVSWIVGELEVEPGEWIIKDQAGKFSSCPSDLFELRYRMECGG